jgi:hypothetical protein
MDRRNWSITRRSESRRRTPACAASTGFAMPTRVGTESLTGLDLWFSRCGSRTSFWPCPQPWYRDFSEQFDAHNVGVLASERALDVMGGLGQRATWPAGARTSVKEPEPDPGSPRSLVGHVPIAAIARNGWPALELSQKETRSSRWAGRQTEAWVARRGDSTSPER